MTRDEMAARRKAMTAMRDNGAVYRQIAAEFGVCLTSAQWHVAREKGLIPSRREFCPPIPDAVKERAALLWDCGFSASQIAADLGVTKNSVIGLAHRHGFPPRPSPIRRREA